MYRIGSFNCHNMGGKTTEAKIDKIVQIIKKEQFDIIALQEVFCHSLSKTGCVITADDRQYPLSDILKKLRESNRSWMGYFAAPEQVRDAKEGYVFIWDNNKVHLPKVKLRDGTERVFYPRIYNQYKLADTKKHILGKDKEGKLKIGGLIRNPLYARFVPNGQEKMEFRLINTHIRFSKNKNLDSDNTDAGKVSPGDIAMRRNEYNVLTDNIYPKIATQIYGSQDAGGLGSFFTIMIGDYNLNLDRPWTKGLPHIPDSRNEISIVRSLKKWTVNEKMQLVTFQEGLTTLKRITPENEKNYCKEQKYSNNFDHSTYDTNRFNRKGIKVVTKKIDAVRKYNNNDFADYRKNISDHIPICLEFENNSNEIWVCQNKMIDDKKHND